VRRWHFWAEPMTVIDMRIKATTPASPAADPAPSSGIHPLNLFAIPLGLAGLGGAWSAAQTALGAPSWPEEFLFTASTLLWLVLSVLYCYRRIRSAGSFRDDLKHPAAGPSASFIPLVGILISVHYSEYLPAIGMWACLAFITALAIVATDLLVHWVTGGVTMQSIHPGYFLPLVAGAFVSSIGFSSMHAYQPALASFGVGVFFWLVIGTVVTIRLMTAGALPTQLIPALAAYLAAPGTACIAWTILHPGSPGAVQLGLTGVLVMMLLMQIVLIGRYRRLPFSLVFWVFTFPASTTANYGVRWFAVSDITGRDMWAWIVLGLATAFITSIAILTLVSIARRKALAAADRPLA
jgi:tellurite resistance protein